MFLLYNEIYYKESGINTVVGAKTIMLFKVVETLEYKGININYSLVIIGFDNKIVSKRIMQEVQKLNMLT